MTRNGFILAALAAFTLQSFAYGKSTEQTAADKARDARMAESAKVAKEAKDREAMRDKTHDSRIKTGKDTSVGLGNQEVNVRTTFK